MLKKIEFTEILIDASHINFTNVKRYIKIYSDTNLIYFGI